MFNDKLSSMLNIDNRKFKINKSINLASMNRRGILNEGIL